MTPLQARAILVVAAATQAVILVVTPVVIHRLAAVNHLPVSQTPSPAGPSTGQSAGVMMVISRTSEHSNRSPHNNRVNKCNCLLQY